MSVTADEFAQYARDEGHEAQVQRSYTWPVSGEKQMISETVHVWLHDPQAAPVIIEATAQRSPNASVEFYNDDEFDRWSSNTMSAADYDDARSILNAIRVIDAVRAGLSETSES